MNTLQKGCLLHFLNYYVCYLTSQLVIIKLTFSLLMKLILNFTEETDKNGNEHLYVLYNYPFTLKQDMQVLINHPQVVLLCDNCQRKLTHAASVITAGAERKDLCFTCFVQMDPKDKKYSYYVRQNMNVTITEDGWNILGELLLVNALQRFGYGHWGQVKNYLDYHGHNYTSKQIEEHYNRFYMTQDLKPAFTDHFIQIHTLNPYIHEAAIRNPLPQDIKLPEVTVQAYNPKREEHLVDYNPQAENNVCDLQFLPTDSPQEVELKYLKLEEYDYHVEERKKREKFVVEHQLLCEEHHKKILSQSIAKNAARKQLKGYTRFMSGQQEERLTDYMAFHSTLSATIRELSKRRKGNNMPSFEEKYRQLLDKKQNRSLENGRCPIDFKVVEQSQPKPFTKCPSPFDKNAAFEKIRLLDFMGKDVKITVIKQGKEK